MKRRKAIGAVARGGRDGSESTELIFETLGLGWGYLELAGTQSPLLCGSGRELAGGPSCPSPIRESMMKDTLGVGLLKVSMAQLLLLALAVENLMKETYEKQQMTIASWGYVFHPAVSLSLQAPPLQVLSDCDPQTTEKPAIKETLTRPTTDTFKSLRTRLGVCQPIISPLLARDSWPQGGTRSRAMRQPRARPGDGAPDEQ